MNVERDLLYIFSAVLAYFAIRMWSPKIAGIILATLVVGVLLTIASHNKL